MRNPEETYKVGRHVLHPPTDEELKILGGWHKEFGGREYRLGGTYNTMSNAQTRARQYRREGGTTKIIKVPGLSSYALYAGVRNPGAAWHDEEAINELRIMKTKTEGTEDYGYYKGKTEANKQAAFISNLRGIPNPKRRSQRNAVPKMSKLLMPALIVLGIILLVKNNK